MRKTVSDEVRRSFGTRPPTVPESERTMYTGGDKYNSGYDTSGGTRVTDHVTRRVSSLSHEKPTHLLVHSPS